jgi:hypothetical protein
VAQLQWHWRWKLWKRQQRQQQWQCRWLAAPLTLLLLHWQ